MLYIFCIGSVYCSKDVRFLKLCIAIAIFLKNHNERYMYFHMCILYILYIFIRLPTYYLLKSCSKFRTMTAE